MNRATILKILTFFAYVLAQALFFNKVVLFDYALCFIYVGFLLTFPFELPIITAMLIGFVTGLSIDVFTNTLGLHAGTSVALMFIRPTVLRVLTPHGGYPNNASPRPTTMGLSWFGSYALILIFVHQFILFFVEYGGFGLFWRTLAKVISSTIFTFVMVTVVQYLFAPKVDKR
jgi:hypothetical protein